MRPMNTYDLVEDQDIYIEIGKQVSAQLVFVWKGDDRATGTTLEIDSFEVNGAIRMITYTASIVTAGLLYLM